MGFREWLSRIASSTETGDASEPLTERRFSLDPVYRFDLQRTELLSKLLRVRFEDRDPTWADEFYQAVWTAALSVPQPPVFIGPDGFPYLRFNLPIHPDSFDANSLCNVSASLLDQAIGAAFFLDETDPVDRAPFVLKLGVLDSILTYDDPSGDALDREEAREDFGRGVVRYDMGDSRERLLITKRQNAFFGAPSNDFLSPAIARALDHHLREGWKIPEPRVGLMAVPSMRPSRTLVIGKTEAQFEAEGVDEQTREASLKSLTWYLPPLRRLMLQPDFFPSENLIPLTQLY